jgi:hypothetical protein
LRQVAETVGIAEEHVAAPIATLGHVVWNSGTDKSGDARHYAKLAPVCRAGASGIAALQLKRGSVPS